jgi:hypothetical protein
MEQFTLWTNIVLSLIGSGILGLLGTAIMTIRYRRQEKAQKDSDAITASSNTVESVTNVSDKVANLYEETMGKLVEVQGKYYKEVLANMELSVRVEKLERDAKVAEYERKENQRRLDGMERTIKAKMFAQRHICLKTSCLEREPKLGTYKEEE